MDTKEIMDQRRMIASNMRGELAKRNISQTAFASALGTTPKTISVRLNEDAPFTTDELCIAAEFFGISFYQLMLKLLQPIDSISQIKP